MTRKALLTTLTLFVASFVLSACALIIPVPMMVDLSAVQPATTIERRTASSFEQVDYQTVHSYQAWLAGYQFAPNDVRETANRFDQIVDLQQLAEYHGHIAGFQVVPDAK